VIRTLKAVVQDFPKTMSVPLKTLGLGVDGVQALCEQTGAQSFSLIEAVSNGWID
jgi:hypothetical protein